MAIIEEDMATARVATTIQTCGGLGSRSIVVATLAVAMLKTRGRHAPHVTAMLKTRGRHAPHVTAMLKTRGRHVKNARDAFIPAFPVPLVQK